MWNTHAEFMYCANEKLNSKIRKRTSKLDGMLLQFHTSENTSGEKLIGRFVLGFNSIIKEASFQLVVKPFLYHLNSLNADIEEFNLNLNLNLNNFLNTY
jgi:hypothetical protein